MRIQNFGTKISDLRSEKNVSSSRTPFREGTGKSPRFFFLLHSLPPPPVPPPPPPLSFSLCPSLHTQKEHYAESFCNEEMAT